MTAFTNTDYYIENPTQITSGTCLPQKFVIIC